MQRIPALLLLGFAGVAGTSGAIISEIFMGIGTWQSRIAIADSTYDTGKKARFYGPAGVAVDAAGTVYVADTGDNTIRKISPAGRVGTLAGYKGISGNDDGIGAAAYFVGPTDVAVDAAGTVYVADTGNNTIRRISPAGEVSTWAGIAHTEGNRNGTGAAARFNSPVGIAVDVTGTVYVADAGNHRIRRITPAGVVGTLAGAGPGSNEPRTYKHRD
ncbi:hypothetical protein GCM10022409_30970 [Hymenobacter glaciei]|uniref:SMP-30/Gluconolactonase/LRE-like region domain-containing protein n=1 Tax=Hymenobacter glaciei TaxID=877209 RepID=A0ABP7UIL4_9BACT